MTPEGMRLIWNRLKRKVVRDGFIYRRELGTLPELSDSRYRLVELKQERLEQMYAAYAAELSERKYALLKRRLSEAASERSFVVLDDQGEIMGYYHLATGPVYSGVFKYQWVNLPGHVHLFDAYTFRAHRGKGAHRFAVLARLLWAKTNGYQGATAIVEKGNTPSERTYLGLGFQPFQSIRLINVGIYRYHHLQEIGIQPGSEKGE